MSRSKPSLKARKTSAKKLGEIILLSKYRKQLFFDKQINHLISLSEEEDSLVVSIAFDTKKNLGIWDIRISFDLTPESSDFCVTIVFPKCLFEITGHETYSTIVYNYRELDSFLTKTIKIEERLYQKKINS